MLASSFRAAKHAGVAGPPSHWHLKRTHVHAAKVELALEHRNLVRGRGARMLEHDEIGLETPRLVSIGCVPAARLAGGVAVGSCKACARAHTR